MIYIVDEDVSQLQSLVAVMQFLGYEVVQVCNADDAYDRLVDATDVDYVLLDVMLGTRPSSASRFSRVDTQDFLTTGLELATLLAKCGNTHFPKRLAFFSMASQAFLVDKIRERSKLLGIPYLDKKEIGRSVMELGDRIDKIIRSLS